MKRGNLFNLTPTQEQHHTLQELGKTVSSDSKSFKSLQVIQDFTLKE